MTDKTLYKFKIGNITTVTPDMNKIPSGVDFTTSHRLIADDFGLISNNSISVNVIDTDDISEWHDAPNPDIEFIAESNLTNMYDDIYYVKTDVNFDIRLNDYIAYKINDDDVKYGICNVETDINGGHFIGCYIDENESALGIWRGNGEKYIIVSTKIFNENDKFTVYRRIY